MKRERRLAVSALLLLVLPAARCAGQDTVKRPRLLPAVSVMEQGQRRPPESAQTPTQAVAGQQMEARGQSQLSDAVRHLTGVALKDYGGVGGVKTVSARGLGSQFSLLEVDGVAVSDCQNGQVDLGRYLTGNSSGLSFANGQSDAPLLSARSCAAGSVLSLETRAPQFGKESAHLRIGMEGGSFGRLAPTLLWEQRAGRRLRLSLWANGLKSDGNYPFTLYYTAQRSDSSSRERRLNSQMRMTTADLNGFLDLGPRRSLHLKAHYMRGFHALPGPVVLYTAKASEHSEEELFFAQGRYRSQWRRGAAQLLAKYRSSSDLYEDTAARTPSGRLLNRYRQQEGYLSQALRLTAAEGRWGRADFSLAADEALSHLASNLPLHNDVQRLNLLAAAAAHYRRRPGGSAQGLRIDARLLAAYVRDREPALPSTSYARLSPYAGASFSKGGLTLRYFFKECYRVPNFNELYYFTAGRTLRPERAVQHNAGIAYCRSIGGDSTALRLSASADGYYNLVTDKIIAVPAQNMFLWSMSNVGRAAIGGIDLLASATAARGARWRLTVDCGYSYQHATDRTDPQSKTYGHQLPYTPAHSGNIGATAHTPWVDAAYTVTLVGSRYSQGQNTPQSRLDGYADHSLTLSRAFRLGRTTLQARLQVLNLFDTQYEVVKSYPMMGRNWRAALSWGF